MMTTFLWISAVLHGLTISTILGHFGTAQEYVNIPTIAKYFNTKGRYEEVNPYLIDDKLSVNKSVLPALSAKCQPIHLTAIIRHGTRYPNSNVIKNMQQLYSIVVHNASGEESWLKELQNQWTMWYTEDMDGRLVQKGVDDLKNLAVRLSKLFPSMISEEKLRAGMIKFITSSKHRCVNSTLSFKAGLTELWAISDMEVGFTVNDTLMRFYTQCARLVQEVDKNTSALVEIDKFHHGSDMMRVREKIANLLGVPHSLISHDMAETAFYFCAYEFTIRTENSPWCQLFDEEGAKVMEYASDLREFWKRGYGYDIDRKASCVLFHDLFDRLNKAATENRSGQKVTEAVTVQVGHAETLLPLLTLLGFFKDNNRLTSNNYAAQTRRSFRTSLMMPYAANLVLVLYDCGDDDLRLQPLLNEKRVDFPGLTTQKASMPRFQDVKELYRELLQGCDFESECRLFRAPAEG
ncbi:multiple inositol polyphosphate phosphatase 1-like isoform X1 [Takifugu flavidus]|uniref:Multiple inositol polyphosphate phosphatase 1 n=1 Tax=Takifugu flavidus TaxID=433684 RepID=A0A5C6PIR9_9TELE|nr:multiple inositol polyphosphate phosphatase 1-like isoform X1 [Takifugu flavidus]TWW78598.1 Multiple inositol polyphosphate phosphatase 1 [Takifugu flavidus]